MRFITDSCLEKSRSSRHAWTGRARPSPTEAAED